MFSPWADLSPEFSDAAANKQEKAFCIYTVAKQGDFAEKAESD